MTTNWTKEELLAYILIWSANADFIVDEAETDQILSKVDESVFKKVKREFADDNDIQRLQKVNATLGQLNYSSSDKADLFEEMKELFLSDGEFNTLEKNLERGFKKIFA